MDDLEISVRERLGEWEASILLDYLKRNPQYNSRMNDALEKYSQNVTDFQTMELIRQILEESKKSSGSKLNPVLFQVP